MTGRETEDLNERALRVRDRLFELIGSDPRVEQIGVGPSSAPDAGLPAVRVHVIEDEVSQLAKPLRVPQSMDGIEVVVVKHGERARVGSGEEPAISPRRGEQDR